MKIYSFFWEEKMKKKIIMVLFAGLLISTLAFTGCESSSSGNTTRNCYRTTAEKMGIIIPTVGITLDELCQSKMDMTYTQIIEVAYMPTLYKDETLKKKFRGNDILYANTPIFSKFKLKGDSNLQIGQISGTITLTDVPTPAPRVYIDVKDIDDDGNGWWIRGGSQWFDNGTQINLSSGNYTNISWSIPIYENDHFSPSNGNFTLYVRNDKDINNSFSVDVPFTPYIDNANADGINLGTVSIKSITLSGMINITHNGHPVKYVNIWARNINGELIGLAFLDEPTPTMSWSMTVQAITDVFFDVDGCGNDEWYFSKENITPINVNNQDKSGIALNVGDMRTITLKGTIFVTCNGQKVPKVRIIACTQDGYGNGDSIGWTEFFSLAKRTSWSITIEASDSAKTVDFDVTGGNKYGFMGKDEALFYREHLSPVIVSNKDKSGIVLNLGDIPK